MSCILYFKGRWIANSRCWPRKTRWLSEEEKPNMYSVPKIVAWIEFCRENWISLSSAAVDWRLQIKLYRAIPSGWMPELKQMINISCCLCFKLLFCIKFVIFERTSIAGNLREKCYWHNVCDLQDLFFILVFNLHWNAFSKIKSEYVNLPSENKETVSSRWLCCANFKQTYCWCCYYSYSTCQVISLYLKRKMRKLKASCVLQHSKMRIVWKWKTFLSCYMKYLHFVRRTFPNMSSRFEMQQWN